MRIVKKPMSKTVNAAEEVEEIVEAPEGIEEPEVDVEVAPEATELLFETEDVAELIAEVTDSEVVVDVDDDTEEITFTVDDVPYVVEPEGDEEILETSRRVLKGKKAVKASRVRRGAKKIR